MVNMNKYYLLFLLLFFSVFGKTFNNYNRFGYYTHFGIDHPVMGNSMFLVDRYHFAAGSVYEIKYDRQKSDLIEISYFLKRYEITSLSGGSLTNDDHHITLEILNERKYRLGTYASYVQSGGFSFQWHFIRNIPSQLFMDIMVPLYDYPTNITLDSDPDMNGWKLNMQFNNGFLIKPNRVVHIQSDLCTYGYADVQIYSKADVPAGLYMLAGFKFRTYISFDTKIIRPFIGYELNFMEYCIRLSNSYQDIVPVYMVPISHIWTIGLHFKFSLILLG
jgi:hypothetical protein